MYKFLTVIITGVFLLSCTTQTERKYIIVGDDAYQLDIQYMAESKSFDLSLLPVINSPICVPEMLWPNEDGNHYFNRYDDVYVTISGSRFRLKDPSENHCTSLTGSGCIREIMPGEELKVKIYLRDFDVERNYNDLNSINPKLYLPIEVYQC